MPTSLDLLDAMTEPEKKRWCEMNGLPYNPSALEAGTKAALEDGGNETNAISSLLLAMLDLQGIGLDKEPDGEVLQ